MKVATVALVYNEERFIGPHLDHIPLDKLVMFSAKPWYGHHNPDRTREILAARHDTVAINHWPTEHEQRNAGLDWYAALGYDWVIMLDPDEFILTADWEIVLDTLEQATDIDAFRVKVQNTYWKSGYKIDPPEPLRSLVAVRPSVRFLQWREVDVPIEKTGTIPIELHHFSWARTDQEVWDKLTHFSHAPEIPASLWFNMVWKHWHPAMEDLHPTNPEVFKRAIPCTLPAELQGQHLWP